MYGKRAFTLVEVLLVAVIIGILASIAIPNFIRSAERARIREAISTLNAVIAAQRTYASESRIFIDNWQAIGMDDPTPASNSWDYFMTITSGGSSVQASASRRAGPQSGLTITMNEDYTQGGTYPLD